MTRMKTKITEVGQQCRHCLTPMVKATHAKPPKYKAGGYYFEWWLKCPNKRCRALYMVESAKRYFIKDVEADAFDVTPAVAMYWCPSYP